MRIFPKSLSTFVQDIRKNWWANSTECVTDGLSWWVNWAELGQTGFKPNKILGSDLCQTWVNSVPFFFGSDLSLTQARAGSNDQLDHYWYMIGPTWVTFSECCNGLGSGQVPPQQPTIRQKLYLAISCCGMWWDLSKIGRVVCVCVGGSQTLK